MADKDDKKTRELQRRLELYKDTLRPGYKKKVETAKKAARGVDTFEKVDKDEKKKAKKKAAAKTDDAKAKRTAAVPKRGTDDAKAKRKEAPRASKTKAKKAAKKMDQFKTLAARKPDVESFQGPSTHKVKRGDTLSDIAKRMGTTIKALMAANPSIKNANMIRIGQTIKGPIGSETTPYKGTKKGELAKSKEKAEQDKLARLDARMRGKREPMDFQSGGMIGASDMSAKKTSAPKKKKMPQYYMGGGTIKKNKPYAYGGRVAKYKE